MAIFRSTIFDNVRQKLANTVMYRLNSQGIMRSNPGKIRNPKTPEQLAQRAKMSLLSDLSRRMAPVIKVGFKPLATKQSVYNAFVQTNDSLVAVDEDFNATLAPEQMLCSQGVLREPEVSVTWDSEAEEVVLTHAAEEVTGLSAKDDNVYVGLFEKERRESILAELGERKNDMTKQVKLPKRWSKENLCIYAFAVSKSKRNASSSYCIELS
ncbi:DUF6266 family protein [Odoribacter lunatus]|uniref:DUF6266 family protein n=1 Tax=Odoribacter lunatus TaxID=2941335 RepID=UPI00203BFF64|nr:DUF6266 family protein [Odoribacter lunatus]